VHFYTDQVAEWLDCGNKDATVYTNARILDIKKDIENLVAPTAVLENSIIIPPCYIGEQVVLKNTVVGPFVSLEKGCQIEDSRITNSIIQSDSIVKNACIDNSLLGKNVIYEEKPVALSIGDFSTQS